MELDAIGNWFKGEWAVIHGAPFSFIAAVAAIAILEWFIVRWEFSRRLANANSTVAMLEKRLQYVDSEAVTEAKLAKVAEAERDETHATSEKSLPVEPGEFLPTELQGYSLLPQFAELTGAQEQLAARQYAGKWTKVSGDVFRTGLTATGGGCHVTIAQLEESPIYAYSALAVFDEMNDVVVNAKEGEHFTIIGEIQDVNRSSLTLIHSRFA